MKNRLYITLISLLIGLSGPIDAASGGYQALYEQGVQYEDELKLHSSAKAYGKALELKPQSREALDGLSRVCRGIIGKKRYDLKTRKLYLDAVKRSKDTARYIKALEFVIGKVPKAHGVRYELAQINLADGDKTKAYKQIRKALNVKPAIRKYRSFLLKTLDSDASYKENFKLLQKMALGKKATIEAKLAYAKVCLLKNRKTAASKQYMAIYKRNKKVLKGDSSAAPMFMRLKKYDIAREMAQSYLKDNPENIPIREILIKCYMIDSTNNKTLRRAIKKLVELEPDTKKWWLKLAQLDLEANDRKAALKHAKIWIERNPKSRSGYKFILSLITGDTAERKTYAMVLEKLIKLEPKKSRDRRKQLGLLKYEDGKYKEAEKLLSMSIKHYPKDHRVWFALGQCRLKLNSEKKIEYSLKKAYLLKPDTLPYSKAYGEYIKTDKSIKNNLELFKKLNRKNPTLAEQIKLAKAYSLNHQFAPAAEIWKKLIKMDPGVINSEPLAARSMLKANQPAPILKNYTNYEGNFNLNIELAEYMAGLNKNKEAVGYYVTAYKIQPTDINVLKNIAKIYGLMRDHSKGLDAYKRALELKPKDKTIQQQAMAMARESRNPNYIKSMQEIIRKGDPTSPHGFGQ